MAKANNKTLKEENRQSGVIFIVWQAALLVGCALVYLSLHCLFPAKGTFPKGTELVHLDAFGRATVVSAEDIDWYVGATKGVPLLAQMDLRNKTIETRAGNLRQQLQDLAAQFSEEATRPVRDAVDRGDFVGAVQQVARFHENLAPGSQAAGGDRLLIQLEETLRELNELQRDQQESVSLLLPPKKFLLFWASPWGILAEVVAWSLFGLFSSLLYHSAQHAKEEEFKKSEVFVGWTKLFYTPVVAIVLILAVTVGILHVGTIDTRIWMIPLFGFLAGFNSRKAAAVVDGLSEWVLGRMARSLQHDEEEDSAPAGVQALQQALQPPKTFDDLGAQAKAAADALLADKLSQLPKSS